MIADRYDLIVLGGGIYGAALFWEASSRGLNALLLEKMDFGSGTSANSLKTIHGGLRSLQRFDLAAVRASSEERRILSTIAPHLIHPLPCLMPFGESFMSRKWVLGAGLKIYDILTWDKNSKLDVSRRFKPCRLLSKQSVASAAPGLPKTQTGAASWVDAQVYHSERLVWSFVKSALTSGAHASHYCQVKKILVERGRVRGVAVRLDSGQGEQIVKAPIVVDCSGPWSSLTVAHCVSERAEAQHYTRAVNVVSQRKLADIAVGLKTVDAQQRSRLLFISPWRNASILGTWYFADQGNANSHAVSEQEVRYILAQINSVLPGYAMQRSDICLVHCGRLPVQGSTGLDLMSKPKILHALSVGGPQGLFMVQGVKLTTARRVAVQAMNQVAKSMSLQINSSQSHQTPLYGGQIKRVEAFLQQRIEEYGKQFGAPTLRRLLRNYGSQMDAILMLAMQQTAAARPIPGVAHSLTAELHYVIENEMVSHLSDLLVRRTDIADLAAPRPETTAYCCAILGRYKDWNLDDIMHQQRSIALRYPPWVQLPQARDALSG